MNEATRPAALDNLSLLLAGEAGSGIQTIEEILTQAFRRAGFHVFANKEYMSRIRGGSNSTLIRIGSIPVRAWTNRPDLAIPLSRPALDHLRKRIPQDTLLLGEQEVIGRSEKAIPIPLATAAQDIGGVLYVNTIAAGAVWGLFNQPVELLELAVKSYFQGKTPEVLENNRQAVRIGYAIGAGVRQTKQLFQNFPLAPEAAPAYFLSGAQAVGLGAIAGGCNFVSAYPMSPSTGVLTFLAQRAREFGLVVEQAEDEISAANMVLGAWYAGARGLTTTSGGGFDLMTEAVSLSGMIETPMVVHLAQRPGPATGLPTRTEQGDLNLALYGGHGEFPRALLAPGNLEQAFSLTRKAFSMADELQIPVFVLTDQYTMDSMCDVAGFDLSSIPDSSRIVRTEPDYRRYLLTNDGISPRGIPGHGTGLVFVDSDEHDERGNITEAAEVRRQMVEKRLHKGELAKAMALSPEWIGPAQADNLVICWGSTLEPLREAVTRLERPDLAILHFPQVYPVAPQARDLLAKARRLILVEGNSTGQFGKLLQMELGAAWAFRILKYEGLPFAVEELQAELAERLHKEVRP
ncbi:MAG: 2-oxoacid:acceptor oxidoreductase subunit alpha [Desulfobacterales bacterium]|nr:2-oxoacid:acceptor oxidoreductase subunit alpha [Desulfobacterales bacterium]MDD3950631.1 2-oxoacid:acceptor oxidoreductase subunit alpha [Desulfobacterales bacterium]